MNKTQPQPADMAARAITLTSAGVCIGLYSPEYARNGWAYTAAEIAAIEALEIGESLTLDGNVTYKRIA